MRVWQMCARFNANALHILKRNHRGMVKLQTLALYQCEFDTALILYRNIHMIYINSANLII